MYNIVKQILSQAKPVNYSAMDMPGRSPTRMHPDFMPIAHQQGAPIDSTYQRRQPKSLTEAYEVLQATKGRNVDIGALFNSGGMSSGSYRNSLNMSKQKQKKPSLSDMFDKIFGGRF